ncbi:MAG: indolepyruvate oxidoreductase subunit beta [Oligosphaeraceae bacterium]
MSEQTISVLMCGVGGQGILLASEITARAALLAGYDVKTNEVHGMAQRGGSVVACIRFGGKVYSPVIEPGGADALLGLEPVEAIRCHHYLKPSGVAAVSTQRIIPVTVSSGNAVYPEPEPILQGLFPHLSYLDALGIAQGLGNSRTANLVLLGALAGMGGHISRKVWEAAIRQCVPEKHVEVNQAAFRKGMAACTRT